MANKQFDLVILSMGSQDFVMPRQAAFQFLDACSGQDVYYWSDHWEGNGVGTVQHAYLLPADRMPGVRLVSPTQFHQAIEARKEYEERKKANAS